MENVIKNRIGTHPVFIRAFVPPGEKQGVKYEKPTKRVIRTKG